ncbi:MAG: IclR family transcriptional regulator [Pseudomonadota bacterium]
MTRRGKPPAADEASRRGIQSLEIATELLIVLMNGGRSMALKDLSAQSGMPPSKVHRYLSSFIRTGLVRQDPISGHYDLGPTAMRLGLAALARFDLLDEAHRVMRAMAQESGLTAILSIWGDMGPTVVRWARAQEQLVTSLALGSVLPVTRSATGHVFAAFLPQALTKSFVAKEGGGKEFEKLLRTVRQHRISSVDSSFIPGLCALAAPVLDAQGEAAAVMTLLSSSQELLSDPNAEKQLLEACAGLSPVGIEVHHVP